MKKLSYLAMGLLVAGMLAGCGSAGKDKDVITEVEGEPIISSEATTPVPTEEPVEVETPEEIKKADTETIINREVVDGMMQSYLTGEWIDAEVAQRRPMAVMVGNNKGILPQWGISQASIIYEAPVEGRISRLMLIIEDYDDLEMVGPVRSSRDYFVYEAMAYDAIYCNWGLAVPYVEDLLKSDKIDNISQAVTGIHNAYSPAFFRRERPGYKDEYRGYMSIEGYEDGVAHLGYKTEYRNSFEQAFTFANDGWPAEYADHEDATLIYPGGTESNSSGYGSHRPWFEWDEEEGVYHRYQFDAAQIDEFNGEEVTVSNVVFKICHGEVRDQNDYLAFGVHGTGKALVFTNGKVIEGTWKRTGDSGANMFYDENGKEIIFNQGKTWICNIWEEYENCISYK